MSFRFHNSPTNKLIGEEVTPLPKKQNASGEKRELNFSLLNKKKKKRRSKNI